MRLDRQRRMLQVATPLIYRTWDEVRAMPAEARGAHHCGSGDLVAHVTVGPEARGAQAEVIVMDRELLVRWMRGERELAGTATDQKLGQSALAFMRAARTELAMQAFLPSRVEDAIWVVLEDGTKVVAIVCLSYPCSMAPGGSA